jgi:hypothetical protein
MRHRDCENCGIEIDAREVVTRCTECKELINKPKTETMNNFKKGDKVFVYPFWVIFEKYISEKTAEVLVNNTYHHVTIELISFTEYTLDGFTQERPFEPVVGQMYYFWDDEYLQRKLVVYGRLNSIEDNPKYIYKIDDRAYYQFCSETNPLL